MSEKFCFCGHPEGYHHALAKTPCGKCDCREFDWDPAYIAPVPRMARNLFGEEQVVPFPDRDEPAPFFEQRT